MSLLLPVVYSEVFRSENCLGKLETIRFSGNLKVVEKSELLFYDCSVHSLLSSDCQF